MSDALPRTDGLLRIATAPLALPAGMRDLLPPRADARRALSRTFRVHFERYGYRLAEPPVFEREEVIARGLSERTRRDLVRLLEPETGDVVALRPDTTPQIARLAATRYRDFSGPLRLMYEGMVVRKPRGRARRHRQIAQAGIECIGWGDVAADVEVIRAATGALVAAGLTEWRVDLGHAAIGERLLEGVAADVRDLVADGLAARDTATLARLLGPGFAKSPMARVLELAGGPEVLERAPAVLPSAFAPALDALRRTLDGLTNAGLGDRVLLDLAEVRGLGYYTGVSFQLLAPGPGEALGAGGRYDTLLERYGTGRPATGCALDLEHVEWALGFAGVAATLPPRCVALAGESGPRTEAANRLRARGIAVAERDPGTPTEVLAFARALGHEVALICADGGVKQIDPASAALMPPAAELA